MDTFGPTNGVLIIKVSTSVHISGFTGSLVHCSHSGAMKYLLNTLADRQFLFILQFMLLYVTSMWAIYSVTVHWV